VAGDRVGPLLDRGAVLGLLVERWISGGIWIVSRGDEAYPLRYKTYLQGKAPPLIFGVGEHSLLQSGGLAIVGSRRASEEDTGFAERIGVACAEQKVPVISGAAKGIDSESMMSAINQRGTAIGVLAEGLGRAAVAPPYHEAIVEGRLALISPYEPEARWFPYTAMERNKLIYALADAALIVASSDGEGGTWAGAVEALKQGQIPIFVKASGEVAAGNRKLIQSGAHEFPQEPWNDLRKLLENPSPPGTLALGGQSLDPRVLEAIVELLTEPLSQSSIAERLHLPPGRVRIELKRAIEEGRVKKTKKPVRYIRGKNSLPLFANEPELPLLKRS
jgi:predicted Rossmann fold nucleotide-binding protein DprA/Smf involved in DNA uptake